ncbi:dimethylamine monooxygenase subunit DmmA family protein [Mycobacterium sp. NAZ190054]|uniref:dimethylamine monooxygenase subunit DmmA family protein n=1 Tax=Mycobacterium sp. NAZ190054 TaxID=1747766 RepID=UPI000791A0B2|nr:dimethylamine monooxygenase subunit DmmA family protein [Mycobacterium sp. NAZ190054]KWX69075.1 hypothetical protein ASJ79_15090 [Mycobacterium sp. NAZ190054]
MIDFDSTSVPAWARRPGGDTPPADTGAAYVVVGVASGQAVAQRWAQALPAVTLVTAEDTAVAVAAFGEALHTARVGVRVALAGPVGACLQLRAATLAAGAEDDEIHVQATETGAIDVYCAHCTTSTPTTVGVDGLVPCQGCGKTLIVYYHVSRRLGRYLGFQVDAEALRAEFAAARPVSEVLS